MSKQIITISREYGSGGRTVGALVAQKLGIPFYDKEVVNAMAETCGFSREFIEEIGEYATVSNSFLFSIAVTSRLEGTTNMMSAADQLYACQANYIRELAEKGPCVIVGRNADYILKDREDTLHAFIHANKEFRADRIVRLYGESEKSPEARLNEKDKRRRVNYHHYTGRTWGMSQNYDISLDSSVLGVEKCADILVSLMTKPE